MAFTVGGARLQAAEGTVVQEVGAVPGPWPGIWSCDYKNLTTVYLHTGTASVAMQNKDVQLAEVTSRHSMIVSGLTLWLLA